MKRFSEAHFTRLIPMPVAVSYAADGADPVPSPARAAADGPDRPTRRGRHMPRTLASRRPTSGGAKISPSARCGPQGTVECGDLPVGRRTAKWVSGGAGSTGDPVIGCHCGRSRAPHVTPVPSPPLPCRLLPLPSPRLLSLGSQHCSPVWFPITHIAHCFREKNLTCMEY